MKNSTKLLYLLFFVTVIPTIYVYIEHGNAELVSYQKSIEKGNEYKATKQLGEAVLFIGIAIGYIICILLIIIFPKNKMPYIVLIIGTIAIVILYYFRIYGIPVIGTDVVIRDISTDWRDIITKICQQILVIPLSILLERLNEK
jgi:fatty acid desaturase